MKRFKNKLAAALLVCGGLAGCKQQLYMTKDDHQAVTLPGLPKDLETRPELSATPDPVSHPAPPTVDRPNREPRYMTLAECFAIALESGSRGQVGVFQSLNAFNTVNGGGRNPFVYIDDLVTFQGRVVAGDDAIRAFALDPAIIGADIEGALSKFDTRWISSMTWNKVDVATANVLNNFNNGDTAQFSSGLFKPLPTGGLAGITFNTNYTKLSNPPTGFAVINPSYQPALNFSFEQPLLRDYGIEINQLLPQHPGSVVQNVRPSGGRTEGILITRIRYEEAKLDFERSVNVMLFNVESVYWSLYANYFALYSAEQGLRQAYLTWQLRTSELQAGKATAHEVAQVRAQFASFRTQRFVALQQVLEAERQLRGILGLPLEDGKRIVPADAPTLAAYEPDWNSAWAEAIANRPELQLARQEVKARQFDVLLQQNNTRADIRFFANYNINGIGTQLDGSEPANALSNFASNNFNSWTLGLRADVPLGTRDAHAALRSSQLNLARSYVQLKNQELRAERFLGGVYQNLFSAYRQIESAREQRVALGEQLRGLYARIQAGRDSLITILQAQQNFASALSSEHNAIANYNIAIAALQYAKGTIQQYNNVHIADGPLPNCTLVKATDNEARRTAGLILRQRETAPVGDGPHPLPGLLERTPPPPDVPIELENAPSPRTIDPIVVPPQPSGFRPVSGQSSSMSVVMPDGPSGNAPALPTLPPTGRPLVLPDSKNGLLNR